MPENSFATLALRAEQDQASHDRAALARDAQHLADTAARYAAAITSGESDAGAAIRIAQAALDLVRLATRLDGRTETSAYLKAIADAQAKEE